MIPKNNPFSLYNITFQNSYVCTYVNTVTITKKEAMDLKESKEGYMGRFGGRKRMMGMDLNYNLKIFKLILKKTHDFIQIVWFSPFLYLEDLKFYTNLATMQKLVFFKDFLCFAVLHCIMWLYSTNYIFYILFP